MKTNIIHILIIAIILVAGWSLFTVLQDIYNNDSNKYDNYYIIGKGKQYLPLTPENYSGQRKYPVYKAPRQMQMPLANHTHSIRAKSTFIDNNNSFNESDIANINIESANYSQSGISSLKSGQSIRKSNIDVAKISRPFSKNLKSNTQRDLADTYSINNTSMSAVSESSGMMRAFGNEEEGDDIEGGGGIENDSFYNDVPVGDGLYLLIIMALLYTLHNTYRNRYSRVKIFIRKNKINKI